MTNLPPDTKLETELQELYIQTTHWLQDISFLETETHFFRNVLERYEPADADSLKKEKFLLIIKDQEKRLAALKVKIPEFLAFLTPFISDLKKEIHLGFLEQYNALHNELQQLFAGVRIAKKELFQYTESIMPPIKAAL